ncbi:unnamed protein product [Porites lobata]|uniref:Uncharacterized protein n=1 Tax=Porites lobata TaxID=104759 RepID=A0ABN8NSB9_9CNID|nr:unnamed protein product [Porites lobata]
MALEQSVNADSKNWYFPEPCALNRWFITSHERASVTTALKDIFSQERTRADVQILISLFTSDLMSNPFT